jgi:TPR repeat protein
MSNLGLLYDTEQKDFAKAIEYYQMAVDKGDVRAMGNLAWLYFQNNKEEKSNVANKLIQKALSIKNAPYLLDTQANILLWQNNFDASENVARNLLSQHNYQEIIRGVTDYFIFLLAKKQLHTAYRLFIDFPALQDQLKPVYYALMTLLKDEYPKEYLKMGEELEATVTAILDKAGEMQQKYSA